MDSSNVTRTHRNTLLSHLPADCLERLNLFRVNLPSEREIEFPGNEIKHLFFPEVGVASMTTTFSDGGQVEVGLCGYESVLGASYLLGTGRSLNRVFMQIPGWGYSTKSSVAAAEFARHEDFHLLVLRYTQAQFIQSTQTAGCNARHSIQQRLARWLLLCHDRSAERNIPLAHQYIAEMLGNQRTSISLQAGRLQKLGLIRYTRSNIEVIDRSGLEKIACECYKTVRDHLAHYADSNWDFGQSLPLRSKKSEPPLAAISELTSTPPSRSIG
jgi:CRP-like cAMP-binding protein